MSDNGISNDEELNLEILDYFGISEISLQHTKQCRFNRRIQEPEVMKKIIKKQCGSIGQQDVIGENSKVESMVYKDHIKLAKQVKAVSYNKLANKAQTQQGIGKTETNLIDPFVVTRKVNAPELIFNQFKHKDCYFDQDSAENWMLSQKNECFICQKHKYTCVFYE